MAGCQPKETKNKKLTIVATTGMIGDAANLIAGTHADVITLMGPGVDPHLYKATHGDLENLTKADLILYNGLHLEGKMGEVFEKLGRTKPVVAVSGGIDTAQLRKIPGFDNTFDPHIWFNVALWKSAVQEIGLALKKQDPTHAETYQLNLDTYLLKLDSLHKSTRDSLATIPRENRILVTAHDAFGYFGDAYEVEVHGLQGISTMSEFGLKDITDLTTFIIDRKIKAIFVESSVSPRSIEAVVKGCQEKGWEVRIGGSLYSDALGAADTPAAHYDGMVSANVKTIIRALR